MTVAGAEMAECDADERADARPQTAVATVSRRRLMQWGVGVTALFAVAGAAVVIVREATGHDVAYGLVPLFDLNGEGSLPQIFSAALLLAAAFLAAACGQAAFRDGSGLRRHWQVLALAFAVLAVDELASLHLLIDRPVAELFGLSGRLPALARGAAGAVLALVALTAYLPFLRRLPRRTARQLMIAGGVYLGAAVGLDAATVWIVDAIGKDTPAYAILGGCEEVLEMAGLLIFIGAALTHLAREGAVLDLRITFRKA